MLRRLALPAVLLATGCDFPSVDSFTCTQAGQCVLEGVAGVCEPTGFCSFPDPSCAGSGRRYGEYAGGGLGGSCVGGLDAGTDTLRDGDPDGPVPLTGVAHVPPAASYGGWADLNLRSNATITTGPMAPTLSGGDPVPPGVVLDTSPQACPPSAGPCPELALLHVRGLTIGAGVTVRVLGSRPLVVLADRDIQIVGLLDVSADHAQPGAGGEGPGQGLGVGMAGTYTNVSPCPPIYDTSGGGGGGHATTGGEGGAVLTTIGGRGGNMYGDPVLTALRGGSGGAPGGNLGVQGGQGGAGGGALQLFSSTAIRIAVAGGINLGGGGGAGGNGSYAGNGGGSGGALVLQAPTVSNAGTLAANGGGGGGGLSNSGQDGLWDWNIAPGGAASGPGAAGGAGGAGNSAHSVSLPFRGGNYDGIGGFGGGGGGAFGRIYVLVSGTTTGFSDTGTISPDPSVGTY